MKKVWLRDTGVRLLGLREEHLASQWVELSLKDAAHRIKKLTGSSPDITLNIMADPCYRTVAKPNTVFKDKG
ncbi:hypothetical protein BSK20_02940 [SR1 bacterium human oral taxon HOT-345]|nr:hypothetical protein BSK20_02940 [SR1 bacterium human oral taxon HOT-345]